ncbi:hypothetical protein PV682_05845 [Streptomyces niveiscabiei]|uniref:hypothetical protein n=1 Tax=Streptomyces niveiscabiei TaxID=164115 RepID=UPI0029AFB266|nr:hypothetical protein [Streptomyces niveiscabiei]MDX3380971.1 hypothetical protein [Streptomyces niveiscabiei]
MKHLRKTLAVAVAATALCTAFTTPAQAARGSFAYYYANGGWPPGSDLPDPQDDHCYNTLAEANHAVNHTDRRAILYRGPDCHADETVTFMDPGTNAPDHFRSVMFVTW